LFPLLLLLQVIQLAIESINVDETKNTQENDSRGTGIGIDP
jgi:hypothetical protein